MLIWWLDEPFNWPFSWPLPSWLSSSLPWLSSTWLATNTRWWGWMEWGGEGSPGEKLMVSWWGGEKERGSPEGGENWESSCEVGGENWSCESWGEKDNCSGENASDESSSKESSSIFLYWSCPSVLIILNLNKTKY